MTPRRPLRLVTYNIHGGIGCDGLFDPNRIVQVLEELDADVVALQEVESQDVALDMLEHLSKETGLDPVAGPTLQRASGASYGNALLTRCELGEVDRIDLSVPGREPRGALDVEAECRGVRLRVLATHLGLRPAERRQQVRNLLARINGVSGPVVLMGDLNEWFLWGRPLRWLHAVFEETPAPATFPASRPLFALDRLWVRPRSILRELATHSSAVARIASDHLPLVAVIET